MSRRERKYVLVVEDTASVAALLRALLDRPGLTIAVAPDCDTAEALIRATPPSVIVLDHMLPGRNGLEIAKLAQPLAIPVVLVSAYATVDVIAQYTNVGVTEVHPKPFSVEALHRTVERLLKHPPAAPVTLDT